MFLTSERMPHVLSPASYWSEQHYRRELEALFLPAWHLVGTLDEFERPGDFITCELLGRPIQVRNFAGELVAASNVCAHRHCLISSEARGKSPRMTCQYHGWEYGADGYTRRIPEANNFAPIDREQIRLNVYRAETCGRLVFVCLRADAPGLREYLGDLYEICRERFGERWRNFLDWNPDYPVNWKIPIENSLEAYHVPNIHARTFREDPGEDRSQHTIDDLHTSFVTELPFSPHSKLDRWFQRYESQVVRWLGGSTTNQYEQHHVFPNLLFSFTDAISLCHAVIPTGPTTARGIVRQASRVGGNAVSPRRLLANGWGRLKASLTRRIMAEDLDLFPAIQRGLQASRQTGVLGRCEERIHAFQTYVAAQTAPSDCPCDQPIPEEVHHD